MKKITKPNKQKDMNKQEVEVVAPSTKTLDFLKAFARTYHVEKSLPESLNSFCIN